MDTIIQDFSAAFSTLEKLDIITYITVALVIQFIRVSVLEYRYNAISAALNDETTMIQSIGNKMDELNDFIRNKVHLKKDK